MRITWPDNCAELLKGRPGEQEGHGSRRYPSAFFSMLRLEPEFARGPEVQAMLRDGLGSPDGGARSAAAELLVRIGDPLGILHLTYNALRTHPLLRTPQDASAGWAATMLLRHAGELTDQCRALLLDGLEWPDALRFMDILAALPAEIVVPHMRSLLRHAETLGIPAAYVLAMKGNDEGRAILDKLVASEKLLDLALIALSHIPDHDTMRYLRAYANPEHPVYRRSDGEGSAAQQLRAGLLRHAQCRRFLLDCTDPFPVRRTMERFYRRTMPEMPKPVAEAGRPPAFSRDFSAGFFVFHSDPECGCGGTGVSAPDLLCEFSSPACQAHCAEVQRRSIRAVLEMMDRSSVEDGRAMSALGALMFFPGAEPAFRHAAYIPGVQIRYDPEDYEQAAVDWILAPGRYRLATYAPCARPP